MPGLKQKNTFQQVLVAGYDRARCRIFSRALRLTPCSQLLVRPGVHSRQHAAGHREDASANDETASGRRNAIQVPQSSLPCCALPNLMIFQTSPHRTGRGLVDALVKIGRNEGILAYWKGFAPYFLRLGNHTAFTFLFLEELKKLW